MLHICINRSIYLYKAFDIEGRNRNLRIQQQISYRTDQIQNLDFEKAQHVRYVQRKGICRKLSTREKGFHHISYNSLILRKRPLTYNQRVEQYGAAVTAVPVSVAVARYQHLPRKAA